MADANGNDWRERMQRLEQNAERNEIEHSRIDRNIEALGASMVEQKGNVDKLLTAIRDLIDRIPPETFDSAATRKGLEPS